MSFGAVNNANVVNAVRQFALKLFLSDDPGAALMNALVDSPIFARRAKKLLAEPSNLQLRISIATRLSRLTDEALKVDLGWTKATRGPHRNHAKKVACADAFDFELMQSENEALALRRAYESFYGANAYITDQEKESNRNSSTSHDPRSIAQDKMDGEIRPLLKNLGLPVNARRPPGRPPQTKKRKTKTGGN
jgi:hypothetical protein